MKILLSDEKDLDITGYNKCLESRLLDAIATDNADEAAKVFHIMLCDAGMTGNPSPDLKELYVDDVGKANVKKTGQGTMFLDATGKPKTEHLEEHDFALGLLDDVKKYVGYGEWDNPNNLIKNDEFFLSSMYNKYGHDAVEKAIDYVEA